MAQLVEIPTCFRQYAIGATDFYAIFLYSLLTKVYILGREVQRCFSSNVDFNLCVVSDPNSIRNATKSGSYVFEGRNYVQLWRQEIHMYKEWEEINLG